MCRDGENAHRLDDILNSEKNPAIIIKMPIELIGIRFDIYWQPR